MAYEHFKVNPKLWEMTKSSCYRAPVPELPKEFKAEYLKALKHKGYDDTFIEDTLFDYDYIKKKCRHFLEKDAGLNLVTHFMREVEYCWAQHDERNLDLVIYRPEVVLFVVLLAKISGFVTYKDYARYWAENYLWLWFLVPNMPRPKHLITEETVRVICTLVPEEEMEHLFKQFFAEVKFKLQDLICNKKDASGYIDTTTGKFIKFKPTKGFDGQEMRASSREGEESRKKKHHIVTLFNCDDRQVDDFRMVDKKNQETQAVIKMLDSVIGTNDNCIYISDSLNAKKDFFEYCDKRGFHYLMQFKKNAGNKKLFKQCEEKFSQEYLSSLNIDEIFCKKGEDLSHGRLEKVKLTMLSVKHFDEEVLPSTRVLSIIKYEKTCQRIVKGATESKSRPSHKVHYFVFTLPFSKESFEQAVHSISVRWFYEQHHNTIDTVLLQDQQCVTKKNSASFTAATNKMTFSVLSFLRQYMSKDRKKPVTFKDVIRMQQTPLLTFQYLIEYFMTPEATE